jgi:STE24 endopeptidase
MRVGGAAVAMVLVAEGAFWLLSPRDEPPDPVPVAEGDYFSEGELERAHEFRDPQRWLGLGGLAIEAAVLVAVALGHPAALRRPLERLARRPLLGAAVAGASVSLLLTAAGLPLGLVSHERAVDVGLSTQSLGPWLWDLARAAGITALLTAGGTALLLFLVRRFDRRWWIPGAALTTGLAVVFVWIAPVVLAPIFNKFESTCSSSGERPESTSGTCTGSTPAGGSHR